ncbi:hypothetical protein LINPERHAP1_LOCUS13199 [Linum perenne]
MIPNISIHEKQKEELNYFHASYQIYLLESFIGFGHIIIFIGLFRSPLQFFSCSEQGNRIIKSSKLSIFLMERKARD